MAIFCVLNFFWEEKMNRFISLQNHLKTTPKTQNKIFSNRIHTINHNSNFFKPINVQNTQNFTFQPVFLNETPQIWTKFTPIDNAVEFIEKQQEGFSLFNFNYLF